jgi:spore coat protein U-like protein
VRCTLNSSYAVNLASDGEDSDWRVMSGSDTANAGYTLQYQIYQSDSTAWSSSNDLSGTGTGLTQSINYTTAVNASQGNKPAGSYTDTVTVTVSY